MGAIKSEIDFMITEHKRKADIINKRAKEIRILKWKNKLKQILKLQKQ